MSALQEQLEAMSLSDGWIDRQVIGRGADRIAELEAINADLLAALEWYQKVVSQFADEKSVLVAENGRALAEQLASDAGQRAKAAIAKATP